MSDRLAWVVALAEELHLQSPPLQSSMGLLQSPLQPHPHPCQHDKMVLR